MTQHPDPASAATAAVDVPPAAAELATDGRLGELGASRVDMSPSVLVTYAIALVAGSAVVGALGAVTELRPLLLGALFGVVIALVAVVVAAKTAVTGRRECYLYTNGFVCRSNRRLRVVRWQEVASVAAQPAGNPSPVGYKVVLTDGSKLFVPVGTLRESWKVFGDRFSQAAHQAGVPIAD